MTFRFWGICVLGLMGFCFGTGLGLRCGKQFAFDNQDFFSCPRPWDSPDEIYCCNDSECCSDPWEHNVASSFAQSDPNKIEQLPTPEPRSAIKSLGKIIGIIIGIIAFLLVLCVCLCCCCPCCLLAKKRQRGEIIGIPASNQNYQPTQNQNYNQYPSQQSQQGYPLQDQGFGQNQQAYPPPQSYPGYPSQYPQQGYPAQYSQQNYASNPPPYPGTTSEAYQGQPAFNPNY